MKTLVRLSILVFAAIWVSGCAEMMRQAQIEEAKKNIASLEAEYENSSDPAIYDRMQEQCFIADDFAPCKSNLGKIDQKAKGGDLKSALYLAEAYRRGHQILPQIDPEGSKNSQSKNKEYLEIAAKLGHGPSLLTLGEFCKRKKITDKALKYFTDAANAGVAAAWPEICSIKFDETASVGGMQAKALALKPVKDCYLSCIDHSVEAKDTMSAGACFGFLKAGPFVSHKVMSESEVEALQEKLGF